MTTANTTPTTFLTRFGIVGVFGRANAGKSTLVNALVGEKVSIISAKPQTTRKRILGIVTFDQTQVVFCDTPGLHPVKNKLDAYMDAEIESTATGLQGAVYVVDVKNPDLETDQQQIERIFARARFPVTLVLNKIDLIEPTALESLKESYEKIGKFEKVLCLSAKTKKHMKPLVDSILPWIPEGPHEYTPEDFTLSSEREIAAEVIREEVLNRYFHEVPHSVAVVIEEFKDRPNGKTLVSAYLYVEKDSQKKIIIGKDGEGIKALGSAARIQLNEILGRDIFLQLWVKVNQNWRKKEDSVRNYGYRK